MIKLKTLLGSLILLTLLSGCAEGWLYKNPRFVVAWYIDDYVDLNKQQQQMLNEQLNALQLWHQNQELPLYIDHLSELETWSQQGIQSSDVIQHGQRFNQHWHRFVERIAPKLYALGLSLSPQQHAELFANINAKYQEREAEYLEQTQQQRQEENYDKIVEQAQKWMGELNSQQLEEIERLQSQLRPTQHAWMTFRKQRTQALEKLLQQAYSSENQQQFIQLMIYDESKLSPQLQADLAFNRTQWQQSITAVIQAAKPEQRQHLKEQFAIWRERFEDWVS
ncbi:hypothetical protein DBZ36_18495 [Alginatibacterium sediminis]|uniref:Lipoprotein n=1 Tax=Alginatibacterium sediminis TaxID=2164068 RepID=A0A420E6Q2_9ALTE|nr:DUF6279 family lipoprotein [Alginatibacterium sediminis]RKF13761.1 hypothetical protein DBZ36_18495 [Alginatibacterium sediminis]